MKLSNIEFGFDNFLDEMKKLKTEKHFDYLVTIVGEDFGPEEGLGYLRSIMFGLRPTCWNVRFTTSSALSSLVIPICAASSCVTTLRVGLSVRTST